MSCGHARLVAALATAAVSAGCAAAPAQSSTPSLTWRDAQRVAIHCQVSSDRGNLPDLESAVCERLRTLAAQGAPLPVVTTDTPLMTPGSVTLIVHGAVHPVAAVAPSLSGQFLVFTVRPFRNTSEDAVLVGTAPAVVPLPSRGFSGPAVDAALGAALSQTLPWKASEASAPRLLPNQR